LEFESNIGDLASIVKVEKRRSAVLEKVTICLRPAYYNTRNNVRLSSKLFVYFVRLKNSKEKRPLN